MGKAVVWSPVAESDLAAIVEYIALDNFKAAMELARSIVDAVEVGLVDQPHMGRHGRVSGTRELVVHKNYIVVYRVTESEIQALMVLHAAMRFPRV